MRIILGSSSPWRQKILAEMGYDFKVMVPGEVLRSSGGFVKELTQRLIQKVVGG